MSKEHRLSLPLHPISRKTWALCYFYIDKNVAWQLQFFL